MGSLEAITESQNEICSLTKCFDKVIRAKALGVQKQIFSFDFIVSISFMTNIMCKLKYSYLTKTLELKHLCIIYAVCLIDGTVKILMTLILIIMA